MLQATDHRRPLAAAIPPAEEVRRRLAEAATETRLLRSLLKLAVRREREATRLAGPNPQKGGPDAA